MVTQGSAILARDPKQITADDNAAMGLPPESMQQRLQLLGSIMQLMMYSPLHRQYTVSEIEKRFMPSLAHNQFRYYAIDGSPIGFVNWAWIDDAIEPHYQTGKYELSLAEWQGGSNLWFPEMIAPFGHTSHIIRDLRNLRASLFPGAKLAKSIRLSSVGKLRVSKYFDHSSQSEAH